VRSRSELLIGRPFESRKTSSCSPLEQRSRHASSCFGQRVTTVPRAVLAAASHDGHAGPLRAIITASIRLPKAGFCGGPARWRGATAERE
jgi:hypothetical protein